MTSDPALDLSAYFARIGYDGPRAPTLETLRAIQRLHSQAIAFENLNPLLALPVRLDVESLQQKLVRSHRGGYCFEHNGLLLHALRALGYRVLGLSGRVVWNNPPDSIPPRSHMILRVELAEGTYIADVGFGMSPTTCLRLVPDIVQETPHESFRLLKNDGAYTLQCNLKGHWMSFYMFDLQDQAPVDYQVANHYVSTWPNSHFVTSLMIAARATDAYGVRHAQQPMSIHRMNGESVSARADARRGDLRGARGSLAWWWVPDEPALAARLARLDWPDSPPAEPHA